MPRLRVRSVLRPKKVLTVPPSPQVAAWSKGHARVEDIVKDVSSRYEGGRPYFEELDQALDNPDVYEDLTRFARTLYGNDATFVVSGHFGFGYQLWSRRRRFREVLLAPGGLRYGAPVMFDWMNVLGISHFVFLDDTLYLGRTMARVDEGLRKVSRRLNGAVVAYDGSHERLPRVHSLFRYFNQS